METGGGVDAVGVTAQRGVEELRGDAGMAHPFLDARRYPFPSTFHAAPAMMLTEAHHAAAA